MGSLYSGEVEVPVNHLKGFIKLGPTRMAFPAGFSSDDVDPILKMAQKDEWHNIRYAVKLHNINEHYATSENAGKAVYTLRAIATNVMGRITSSYSNHHNIFEICAHMSD